MRPRLRAAATLGLLAALLLLPTATACSWVLPSAFSRMQWTAGDAIAANDGHTAGRLHLADGQFDSLVRAFPGPEFAASPDGQWLVYGHNATRPPENDPPDSAACELPLGATVAVDLLTGAQTRLLDGAPRALAAGPDGVAVAHAARGLLFYPWGEWEDPRHIPVPQEAGYRSDEVRALHMSPHGDVLAAEMSRTPYKLHLIDGERGGFLYPGQPALAVEHGVYESGVAFSPVGDHVAVAWDGYAGNDAVGGVRVFSLGEGGATETAAVDGLPKAKAVAWGAGGLAVTWRDGVRLHPDAPDLDAQRDRAVDWKWPGSGLAWSPDGDRLAVGAEGALRVYDDQLRPVRAYERDDSASEPRFTPLEPAGDEYLPVGGAVDVPAPGAGALIALGFAVRAFKSRPRPNPQ